VAKIFYIWDYWLNQLPEPAPAAEAKIIPFPGHVLNFQKKPLRERLRIEGFIQGNVI
jgi:hypothetical protein